MLMDTRSNLYLAALHGALPGPGGKDGASYSWLHGVRSWRTGSGLPELSPVAFSSESNFGDIWPTPGEAAVEGEACELSPQRTVMKTRHPEANTESAPWGEMRSQAVMSHSTPGTAMQAVPPPGWGGHKCLLELPMRHASEKMQTESRLSGCCQLLPWSPGPEDRS